MVAWSDNFNRADGPLTAPWSQGAYMPSILGGHAYAGNNGAQAVVASQPSAEAHDASITLTMTAYGPLLNSVIVKSNIGVTGFYNATISGNSGAYTVTIGRTGATQTLATAYLPVVLSDPTTLRLTYNAGNLYAIVNGVTVCWARDTLLDANLYCGMGVGRYSPAIDEFAMSVGAVTDFQVSPGAAQTGGQPVLLSFTGAGTAWTPGIPGAPTFTVSAGSLSDQSVNGPSSAVAWFTPPLTDQTVVVTDPSTGLTDTVVCNASGIPGGGGGFAPLLTEEGAATINRAENVPGDQTVLTDLTVVIPAAEGVPALTFVDAIWGIYLAHYSTWGAGPPGFEDSRFGQLLAALMGSYTPTVQLYEAARVTSIREELEGVTGRLSTLIGAEEWTLDDLFHNLGGEPFANHQDILAAIAAISGGSNQDVLDMLSAMWGTSTPTLTQIAELIGELATIAGYTLGDVLSAIAAQDVHGHTEQVLAAIAALRGDGVATVAGSYQLLSDVNDALQEVKTSLQEIRAPSAYTFQDVLDAIAAIQPGGGSGTSGAPAWPGLASVTIGAQWPLSTGLTVTAPMDGVVVQITAVAPKLNGHLYTYHNVACYRNVGALAFVSDRGDVETYQALGFTEAIYTPRAMRRAAAVKIMTPAGTAGSVRPWTINP